MNNELAHLNRNAYDQIADRYAERNSDMAQQLVDSAEFLIQTLKQAGVSSPRFLDLGCGSGRDLNWFSTRQVKAFGVDLSHGMLSVAQKSIQNPLAQMDMRFLGFIPASFDCVWCQASLLHLQKSELPAALLEIRRILKIGGLIYISVQKGTTEGIESRPYEPVERYYAHYQSNELEELTRKAGFAILRQGERQDRRQWLWLAGQKE